MNAAHRRSRDLANARRGRMTSRPETRSNDSFLNQFLRTRSMTTSGAASLIKLTEATAMSIAAVFGAVRTLAESKATLPIDVYERRPKGEADVVTRTHPVSEMLRTQPNAEQTPFGFQEQRQSHIALWGNNYAELAFDPFSVEVVAATVHHPSRVTPYRDPNARDARGQARVKYEILLDNGARRVVDSSQMVHVPWLASDGINGTSVVSVANQSFGIAAASDRLAAKFFANAATPSIIVTSPEYLDDPAFERLSREINTEYNDGDAFRSMLLEGGATASYATIPFKDVQLLEARIHSGKEISQVWFRLPPHVSGYGDTPADLDAEDRRFVIHTLTPWLVRDEQEWNRKAFTGGDRGRFYVKHNTDAFLRGDLRTRYEAHRSAVFTGWKTINEVRAVEDMPPVEGGDVLPRPAAIWGNDKPEGADKPTGGGTRSDDRLKRLTTETIDALMGAEKILAERHAGKPDFDQRVGEFYARHAEKLSGRLAGVADAGGDLIAEYCESHAADLRHANTDPSPADALTLCVDGWTNDPAKLADRLLNSDLNLDIDVDH